MGKYFDKFPLVDYNGVPAKNILVKVDFSEETKRDIYSSFDYVLEDTGTRPDFLSHAYYNSSRYDWLVYLTNGTIDPYHDFHMMEQNFDSYIKEKYNTIYGANEKILFYRNNWAPDQSIISEILYESMTMAIKKYYKPVLNNTNQIIGYSRRQDDWIRSTNKIIELTIDSDATLYSNEQIIKQTSSNTTATVIQSDSDKLIVQHVSGNFSLGVLDDASSITAINVLSQIIPDEEAPFWAPVSAYDYEVENNSLKRYISLIKSSYLPDVDKLLTQQLKA